MAKPLSHKDQILASMGHIYQDWLSSQELPSRCAVELLHEDHITVAQAAWLTQFSIAWGAIENMKN